MATAMRRRRIAAVLGEVLASGHLGEELLIKRAGAPK